jgi:hypothetical protein
VVEPGRPGILALVPKRTPPSPQQWTPETGTGRHLVANTLARALAALRKLITKANTIPAPSFEGERPEVLTAQYAAPYDLDLLPDLPGELPRYFDWYVAVEGNAEGPFTVDDLNVRWSRGELSADTPCWREGMDEWRPLAHHPILIATISQRPRKRRAPSASR